MDDDKGPGGLFWLRPHPGDPEQEVHGDAPLDLFRWLDSEARRKEGVSPTPATHAILTQLKAGE